MVPSPPLRSCDSGLIMDTGLTGKLCCVSGLGGYPVVPKINPLKLRGLRLRKHTTQSKVSGRIL